eukprot:463579-Rhodomonas_salina.3
MAGTDVAYGATRKGMEREGLRGSGSIFPAMMLRSRYAKSGIDIGNAARRRLEVLESPCTDRGRREKRDEKEAREQRGGARGGREERKRERESHNLAHTLLSGMANIWEEERK